MKTQKLMVFDRRPLSSFQTSFGFYEVSNDCMLYIKSITNSGLFSVVLCLTHFLFQIVPQSVFGYLDIDIFF